MNFSSDQLGYTFKNPDLLKIALTHRSYSANHNERLEFLGDSLLNLIIANALYHYHPKATEGELSRLRAQLVQEKTLADIARELNLGHFLLLGLGELKTGGANRNSLLADALESLIGAIFLDSHFDQCQQFVLNIFQPQLNNTSLKTNSKDPKTTLQEYLQSHQKSLPLYDIIQAAGESHQQTFTVRCRVQGLKEESIGISTSRRKAEQEAAKAFLNQLGLSTSHP